MTDEVFADDDFRMGDNECACPCRCGCLSDYNLFEPKPVWVCDDCSAGSHEIPPKISILNIYLLETYLEQMKAEYLNRAGNFREEQK